MNGCTMPLQGDPMVPEVDDLVTLSLIEPPC